MKPLLLICCVAGLCLGAGCKKDSQATHKNKPDEAEVREILVPGKLKAEVDRTFGAPIFQHDTTDGTRMAVYDLLSDNRAVAWDNRFSGFQAYYDKNDRLLKWSPAYSTRTLSESNNVSLPAENLIQGVQLYIVSDSELTPGRFIDTPKFPKLGYIAEKPDLVIEHIESLQEQIVTTGRGEKQLGVVIAFSKEDAAGLEKLTRNNVLQKALIIVDGQPVAAPLITAPITDGKVQIDGLTKDEIQRFIRQKENRP